MTTRSWRIFVSATAAGLLGLSTGCTNSPPGAGFTTAEPSPRIAPEDPAVHDDLAVPRRTGGPERLAEPAAELIPDVNNSGNPANPATPVPLPPSLEKGATEKPSKTENAPAPKP